MCHVFILAAKVLKLIGEGSVINGAQATFSLPSLAWSPQLQGYKNINIYSLESNQGLLPPIFPPSVKERGGERGECLVVSDWSGNFTGFPAGREPCSGDTVPGCISVQCRAVRYCSTVN